ncbi:MAG: alpha-ketoglutarate-dependent dioxygenase AlkB family protein [Wenzhouxiangella sp.]
MPEQSANLVEQFDLAPAGYMTYWPAAALGLPADRIFARLRTNLDWQQQPVRLFGRSIPQPRMTAFHGDPGVVYRYSGLSLNACRWSDELDQLRHLVQECSGERFNSVLCNLYRDGRDYMGWHADDEPELGPDPVVASLSFGAHRRFLLKRRDGSGDRLELILESGSLLIMGGDLQRHWLHQLPRALRVRSARINLTFRRIY